MEQVRLPNGVVIDDYFMIQMRSWVAVLAVTDDGRVPLVRQYRYGVDAWTLELPAGYLENGEAPEVSARRELLEEAGCAARSFEVVGSFTLLAPRGDMRMSVVLARGAYLAGEQALEPTEEIEVRWMTVEELRAAWRAGAVEEATHAQAVACGLAALDDTP